MSAKQASFLTKSAIVSIFLLFFLINVVAAQSASFLRPLKFGSMGEDVRNLQKILNMNEDTAIRGSGIGSPGQESTYFGALTRAAVVRFQEKYRNEILVPNGLVSGTGYVGLSTLSVINRLANSMANQGSSGVPATPAANGVNRITGVASTPSNPNEENLDVFLAAVDRVGKEKGMSPTDLQNIKNQIRVDVATSTDLKKTFIQMVEKTISKAPPQTKTALTKFFAPVLGKFSPKRVEAAGVGFGGKLLFSFFCTCSGNWLITLQPLPPTYVTLLSYTPGTQAHLSYNIPFTTNLFGIYTPGAGVCAVYAGTGCANVPSEGMITPTVGSSAI